MSKSFLITRPEHDNTTNYLSRYSELIIEFSKKKGIIFFDFRKDRVIKAEIKKLINKKNPKLIIFNGHGTEDSVRGHKDETLVKVGENEDLLNGRMVYAVSCQSARVLGRESKAESYIGYNDDFVFVFDKNKTADPLKDNLAKNFLEPSNELVISLLKGNNAKESCDRSKNMFKKNINRLLTSEAPHGSENIARYLFWDLRHQVLLGNEEAVF